MYGGANEEMLNEDSLFEPKVPMTSKVFTQYDKTL